MEWLAFEPEHALIFAHAQPHRSSRDSNGLPKDEDGKMENVFIGQEAINSHSQLPLGPQKADEEAKYGYLHTYSPQRPLHLLYIDGLSAGKTSNGTLDTQDMLLLNFTDSRTPMGRELERAHGLCNLTATLWEGKIDGILRMEGGFEIILCDFSRHVQRIHVIPVSAEEPHNGFAAGPEGWPYLKAVTSRYHGIGGDRVTLDHENFVSVFAYPDMDGLFVNDVQSDYAMPRLQNVSDSDRLRVKDDVTAMILHKDWSKERRSRDWQAVADMVVQRYSKPLHFLYTSKAVRDDKDSLVAYLESQLRPFIDPTDRNATLETQRCVAQVVPRLPSTSQSSASLAHLVLYTFANHICDTLLTALLITSPPQSHMRNQAMELIDRLVEYLQWTTWKDCGGCTDEEICFIPMWPLGTHEDHAHPQCRSEGQLGTGYWGSKRGRRGQGMIRGDTQA
ncbi:hypothetical protein PtrSN002B_001808 [Pyrenophora tritici-repentis]|uniref:Uncharacterized protein n=2 Tax=Pyrenophora tritici-repentis TaxID=45151 RepID=A0A922NAW2_9PLEO|nr:uncharacterized protein PTRG_06354 [Pyrenophora tritici-repentis Pt-1C-BFP]KAI1512465.1 hypothetical protein Ptr86124_008431 [Pyrenophora tritici-repentis]EDU49274.1 conserved hypothetical protein [Pyrenophora tritici-repentis Pt-1C-BFP]KAI1549889.1 hypothetical protein PtrSN001A_000636 [Pyrenophora tritici-repentis]KAI1556798.1 hypothetical protein PtrSN002B_001808 [Pyrenophora tritici-repentis]KAI1665289.1 hypothetical protein L13192_10230 [Pyrenophora tritici-repentis]